MPNTRRPTKEALFLARRDVGPQARCDPGTAGLVPGVPAAQQARGQEGLGRPRGVQPGGLQGRAEAGKAGELFHGESDQHINSKKSLIEADFGVNKMFLCFNFYSELKKNRLGSRFFYVISFFFRVLQMKVKSRPETLNADNLMSYRIIHILCVRKKSQERK